MRTNHLFFCLIISVLSISTTTTAQTANFDETWVEFLENNKISNMSALVRPDPRYDLPDYAKYLLMNTNTDFCQSDVEEAESLMTEIQRIDSEVLESIEGYVKRMKEIQARIEAYHSMDAIWQRFLQTKDVRQEELEAVEAAKMSCEKSTLAKYSYMTAHNYLCQGEVTTSKNIFENRTLKLAEKTSLRVEDVPGMAEEVAKMKAFYQGLPELERAWDTYIETGVSPGFDLELPLFPCYPMPNLKEALLKGLANVCDSGQPMLDRIEQLQEESGITPDWQFTKKVKDLEEAIQEKEGELATLQEAWEAFIPDNEVKNLDYGYDYCSKEPLIRAYIMDGFSYVCGLAEEMLYKIDSLQAFEPVPLEPITMTKISELGELYDEYQSNETSVDELWNEFVALGDTLYIEHPTKSLYCDNIDQVKDWTIQGFCGTCEDANMYLDQIEEFQRTFEFSFFEDLECRVQNLRVRVWDCRYQALQELADIDSDSPESYEKKLEALMDEYKMGPRPEVCPTDR